MPARSCGNKLHTVIVATVMPKSILKGILRPGHIDITSRYETETGGSSGNFIQKNGPFSILR
jgi:hypothetical protein